MATMTSLLRSTHRLLSRSHRYHLQHFSSAAAAAAAAASEPSAPIIPNPNPKPSDGVLRLVDEVTSLTLTDIADLTHILAERSGLGAVPAIGVMGAGSSSASPAAASDDKKAAGAGAAKEEKTVFEVKLEGFDAASKIKVIKEVRGFTDLGLKEAKELVEKAPVVIKGGFSKEEGLKIVEKMAAVGAKVVLE